MPYFPDLVRARTNLWLYVGDNGGQPTFRHTPDLGPGATIEARNERRAQFHPGSAGGVPFATLAADETGGGIRSLAGNDVMIDTEGRLYIWDGRFQGHEESSWMPVAPEEADEFRRNRDAGLSEGNYRSIINPRRAWEELHGNPRTFTEPEPSIDPTPDATDGSYQRQSVTVAGESLTFAADSITLTPLTEPPAEAVLVTDAGCLFAPAGTNGDHQPMWRGFNMATSTWRQVQDRHRDAHRARTTGRGGGGRDTFAGWSRRFPAVRVMTPADLPPDLVDGRGRTWLHVGWHEGPRYRLAEGGRRPFELERRDLMASCPESGFNVARAWTRDRIERTHGGVTERPRRALPYFLVGSGETAVAPGQGVGPTPARAAAPASVVVDPAAGVRPGDTPTPETWRETVADWCTESGPRGSYRCSRRPGHAGHHVAAHSTRVVAVWTDREHYLPEFGGEMSREQYTALLHARGIVAPGETLAEPTPSGSMIAEPTDPVERALAALAAAEQTESAYRERVRDRAIRGYTSDREYSSPAAVNISLRNLHLPEYKVTYRAQVMVEFDVESDDPGAARRVAADMARPLSNVTPTAGVSGPVTARVDDVRQSIVR